MSAASPPPFEAAFRHGLDAQLIADDDGLYVDASDAACALIGLPRDELIGRGIASVFGVDPFDTVWAQFLAKGSMTGTVTLRREGAAARELEFAARAHVAPGRHLSILRDRTEQAQRERVRAEEREVMDRLQEIAGIGAWTAGLDGEPAAWSSGCYRICGLPAGSTVTSDTYFALVHPADRDAAVAAARRALEQGTPLDAQHRIIRPDGEERWVLARGEVQRDRDGAPTRRLVGVLQDVTAARRSEEAMRRAEEQLRQAQKMEAVGVLAGGVAHDFNNLLSVILGFTTLTLDDLTIGEEVRDSLGEVQSAANRAVVLTRQLLAFSRKQMLEPRAIDLNEVVGSMVPMFRRLVGAPIRVQLELASEPAWVLADPSGIEQIVMNLVVNARDAMPDGGQLTVEVRETAAPPGCAHQAMSPAERAIELSVRDTGHGIATDVRPHIFEPFFTTKEIGKGTGLGLSTVFGIVQQSGGCIEVTSTSGHGARFSVYLPRHGSSSTTIREREERRITPGSETILLVEDDDQVRALCRRILERSGYAVIDAQNAGEALLASEQHDGVIDLMLTDVVMPRMNGRQLAERLVAARPTMKVVFMSGYTDDAAVREAVAATAAPFLPKPITPAAMAQKVREVLDGITAPISVGRRAVSLPPAAPGRGGAGGRP